jgi:hypothetical protein
VNEIEVLKNFSRIYKNKFGNFRACLNFTTAIMYASFTGIKEAGQKFKQALSPN